MREQPPPGTLAGARRVSASTPILRRGALQSSEQKKLALSHLRSALSRIGAGPAAWAKWLGHFAVLKLDVLTEDQWLSLRWEVSAFQQGAPQWLTLPSQPVSEQTVRDLQAWLRRGLTTLSESHEWLIRNTIRETWKISQRGGRLSLKVADRSPFGRVIDAFSAPGAKFLRCPVCGTATVTSGKRQYCTRQCSGRRRVRAHRARRRAGTNGRRKRRRRPSHGVALGCLPDHRAVLVEEY